MTVSFSICISWRMIDLPFPLELSSSSIISGPARALLYLWSYPCHFRCRVLLIPTGLIICICHVAFGICSLILRYIFFNMSVQLLDQRDCPQSPFDFIYDALWRHTYYPRTFDCIQKRSTSVKWKSVFCSLSLWKKELKKQTFLICLWDMQ